MANIGAVIDLNDSAGAALAGATKTDSFDTQWVALKGKQRYGFYVQLGTVAGTTPTWNADLEASYDGGTTVDTDHPVAVNSDTGGVMAQLTSSDEVDFKWFDNPWPDNDNLMVRLEVTIGGTSESFGIDKLKLVTSDY